jgi:hypothetical protein
MMKMKEEEFEEIPRNIIRLMNVLRNPGGKTK